MENSWWNSFVPKMQDNRSAVMMAGLGLLSGQTPQQGFANIARTMPMGMMMDQNRRQQTQQQAQRNKTLEWARANLPQYAGAVDAGVLTPADAYRMANKKPDPRQMYKAADGYNYWADNPTERVNPNVQTPRKLPTSVQEYQYGQENPDYRENQLALKKAGATKVNFNEGQANSAGFADRMANSEQIIQKYEQAGTDIIDRGVSSVPVFGNRFASPELQMLDQAKRDFVNALLRKESGAVIGKDEFENADRQYFPQPGDSPEVIEQKRRNRQIAIQAIQRSAGPNYEPQQSAPSQSLPSGVTEEDIQHTMQIHGLSREEVLQRIGGQ